MMLTHHASATPSTASTSGRPQQQQQQALLRRQQHSSGRSIASSSSSRRATGRRSAVLVAAAEGFCRDKVNVDSRGSFQSQGKTFTLTFKGVGDEAKVVTCPDDTYILEAAEAAGLDLPATCKSGICGTCVGRIVGGTFDASDIADIEFTISPDEQAQGLAMLCMTRPCSDLTIETQCDWGYSLGVKDWEGATGRFSATPEPLMGETK